MDYVDLYPKEAEGVVIATILMNRSATALAARYLKPEHFYEPRHSTIYTVCLDLWKEGVGVDLVTVAHRLNKAGTLSSVGGYVGLGAYGSLVSSSEHLHDHCGIIREMHSMRVLRAAGQGLMENTNLSTDPMALISSLQQQIIVASHSDISTDVNLAEETYRVLNEPAPPKPLRLGITGIDKYLAIYDGNVIVVSADPGVGKTTTVWNGVLNVAASCKVWYVSLEMPAKELCIRTACKFARVNMADAFQDRLTAEEKTRMALATQAANSIMSTINIEDSGSMSIEQYASLAEHKVKSEGVQLIVVDYLQLMTADSKQYKTEYEVVTAASKCVRRVARTLNVKTIVVSQLSREGQLRSSNQILQDAHVDMRLSADPNRPGFIKASFKKNRNGPLGSVDVPTELEFGSVGANTWTPELRDHTAPAKDEDVF